jgi:hypothetical protein
LYFILVNVLNKYRVHTTLYPSFILWRPQYSKPIMMSKYFY